MQSFLTQPRAAGNAVSPTFGEILAAERFTPTELPVQFFASPSRIGLQSRCSSLADDSAGSYRQSNSRLTYRQRFSQTQVFEATTAMRTMFLLLLLASSAWAADAQVHPDLPYAEPKNQRQT